MNSAFKAIREFHDMIGKNNIFRGWIALCAIISYGFSTVNRTISIDNLSDDRYYFIPRSQSGVLAGKRWGLYIYRFLFGSKTGITATDRIIAAVFAALAAYLLCTLFFTISEKEMSPWFYAVVASTFITYPLINEISEYPTLYSYIEIEFCAIIIAVLTNITNGKSVRARSIAIETCLLCIVTSGYESLVFAYITLVLLVLVIEAINAEERCSIKNILFEGVIYAIPLILAVIIKYAVGYLLVFIYDIHSAGMGATQILWNNGAEWAWTVIKTNIYLYFARGVLYFPVGVFVITSFVTFILLLINKKNKLLAIAFWLFALMSVFGQSVVQCSAVRCHIGQHNQYGFLLPLIYL